jgi:hypothetical protein
MLGCAAVVTVPAVVAAPVNAPTNVVLVTLDSPATVVTVAPKVSAVLPNVTAALANLACARVPELIFVALMLVTLAPEPFNVPTKLPLEVLPVTAKLLNVPTEVIFGCAAVVTVPAVVAEPLKVAVIVPALKLPLASRATIALTVFALVAVEPNVTAPVDTLAVMPPPLAKLNTPVLVIVTPVLPL